MTDKIKGITLEIGADAAGVKKALKDVDKEIKGTSSELKQVNRLLKLDPKNTELLAQKQELLAKEISSTSDKLEAMKKAKADLDEKMKSGTEVNREQYRYLQREISYTEDRLKKLENAADTSNEKLDKVAEVTGKLGEKSEKFGKKMLSVSGGIAAIGAASVAAFNELDAGYDTIVTKTGATGKALDGLQNSMNNVYGDLPTTAENAGIAIGEVNTRFGATGKTLENLSKQFIEFAEINETDLNNSIGMTNKIMQAWNIDAEKTPNVLGLITVKAQETGISVDTLMNSVLENNSVFKEMGLTFEQSIGLMANFEKNGVNSTVALAGLKKAVVNYAKEGYTMEEGLKKTIEAIKNASSETEALKRAQEVFGTKGAPEMTNAIREGRLSVEDLCKSMEEYKTTVDDTFNATLDPPDEAKVALNNLKTAAADLGAKLLTSLAPVLKDITKKVKQFASWFTQLNDKTKLTIIKIGGVVAAIGPALIAFGKMSTGISAVVKGITGIKAACAAAKAGIVALNVAQKAQAVVTKIVTAAQWLWNAAMTANPIGAIIVLIAAVIAAVVLLYNKCEPFRNFVNNMLAGIKQGFSAAWEGIKLVWSAAKDFFKSVWEAIKGIFSVVKDVLAAYFHDAWEAIKLVWSVAKDYFKLIWENIKTVFSVVKSVLTGDFKGAWEGIKQIWNNTKEFFAGVWKKIKSAFKASEMKDIGVKLLKGLWNGINDTVDWLKKKVKGVVDKIKSWFTGKKGFDEHSPSKWAEKVGKFVMEGLANGVTKDMSAEEAFEKKIANLKNFISENLTEIQNDIANKQNSFSSNLKNKASLYDEYKITIADETYEGIKLKDWTKDLEKLTSYSSKLSGIEQRLRSLGGDAELDNTFLQLIRDMGMDGEKYIDVLINAADSQFAEYIDGFRMYQQEAEAVAEKTYATESAQLKKGFLDEVGGSIDSIVAAFGDGGADSAKAFGANFLSQIQSVLQEAANSIQSFATVVDVSGNLTAQSGTSISNTNNSKSIAINIKNTGNASTAYQQRLETEKMLDKLALQGVL